GRDVARRPAPVADPRLRAAAGVAPQALPRPAGDDGTVAGLRPHRSQLRRPGPAGLLLHRELVDLARHLDPREDAPRRARTPRRVLGADPKGSDPSLSPTVASSVQQAAKARAMTSPTP